MQLQNWVNFYLVYLCHNTETCTESCARRRRRGIEDESTSAVVFSQDNGANLQPNGLPPPQILTAEIVVPDNQEVFASEDTKKLAKTIGNLDLKLKSLQKAVRRLVGPIKKLNEFA